MPNKLNWIFIFQISRYITQYPVREWGTNFVLMAYHGNFHISNTSYVKRRTRSKPVPSSRCLPLPEQLSSAFRSYSVYWQHLLVSTSDNYSSSDWLSDPPSILSHEYWGQSSRWKAAEAWYWTLTHVATRFIIIIVYFRSYCYYIRDGAPQLLKWFGFTSLHYILLLTNSDRLWRTIKHIQFYIPNVFNP